MNRVMWLKTVPNDKVEFQSNQFEDLKLDRDDVAQIYTAQPFNITFEAGEPFPSVVPVAITIALGG